MKEPQPDFDVDILVIGGCAAAIKAKEGLPGGTVLLLEKANVKRSGTSRVAGFRLPDGDLRKPFECRRRLFHGGSRGCRADEY